MCGGIVGLLHAQIPAGRGALAIGFHVGRIASYTVIGLVATGLGMLPAALVPAGAPQVMRLLLGVIIVAMAVYIALPGRFRDVAGQLAAHAQIPLGHQPARTALAGGRPAGAYRAADRAGAVAGPSCGPAVDSVSGGLRDLTPGVRDRGAPTTAARP